MSTTCDVLSWANTQKNTAHEHIFTIIIHLTLCGDDLTTNVWNTGKLNTQLTETPSEHGRGLARAN